MVRTTSARLLRSIAQAVDLVARPMPNLRLIPLDRFVTAALLQSCLVVGLVLTLGLDLLSKDAAIAQLVGALAVLMSVYVGYVVVFRGAETPSWGAQMRLASGAASAQAFDAHDVRHEERRQTELEQIIHLKARISHELRTPLNAVVGFADMMHREVLGPVGNERYREYAAHIAESAERFQIATEKTLAVAELLASPRNLEQASITLEPLVRRSLDEYRIRKDATSRHWSVTISKDVVIAGNRAALEEALLHLWDAGQTLADGHAGVEPLIYSRSRGRGVVELCFILQGYDASRNAADPEAATGAELSLLLARLGIEAAGGELTIEAAANKDLPNNNWPNNNWPNNNWQVTVRLYAPDQGRV